MTLEAWNTLATFGTFVVISATAIAAIVQLRHARGSNQIAVINELRETTFGAPMQEAQHVVSTQLRVKLQDPEFRRQYADRSLRTDENRRIIAAASMLGNFYETMGVLVKSGLVDRKLALDIWSGNVVDTWNALAPALLLLRRAQDALIWENFEYLTVLSQDWLVAHAGGTYPPGIRRIVLDEQPAAEQPDA